METNNTETLARMREMATRVKGRPLLYGLVMADIYRWPDMGTTEQEAALRRTMRRVSVVEPQMQMAM